MSKTAFRNEKYEATGETKEWFGVTLHRIRAVADIAALGITIGTLGGWIEKPSNLDVFGNAWVFGNAQVFGDACHVTISPIGSEGGCLTAFVQADGTVLFNRGCFSGTDAEFLEAVEQKHGDGPCAIEYRAAVELIKLRLSRAKDAK